MYEVLMVFKFQMGGRGHVRYIFGWVVEHFEGDSRNPYPQYFGIYVMLTAPASEL